MQNLNPNPQLINYILQQIQFNLTSNELTPHEKFLTQQLLLITNNLYEKQHNLPYTKKQNITIIENFINNYYSQ